MRKIKIGVLGTHRGGSMIDYCSKADNAEVVAICDKWEEGLEIQKQLHKELPITYYTKFEEFIKHDMDAVVLANYAHQHAPFAIAAMKAGKHVFSEVLPAQTMKEAVELIEAVEETGMTYAYGENYCYIAGPYEMKRLYEAGEFGEFEYAECEYVHNCDSIWPRITYGDPNHWRNRVYSTFYCTHSLGPIIHITGLRPVSVIGIESSRNDRPDSYGLRGATFGMELVTMENGGIVKSLHGGLYKDSHWYCLYGSKGKAETARQDANSISYGHLYTNIDEYERQYKEDIKSYVPKRDMDDRCGDAGHGGSDFYSMYHFAEKLLGNPEADIIDVYEAMDMTLPGMFAYRSILAGSVPMEIPNLRNKEERDKWRNDVACTDPEVAGDMLWPTRKGGTPNVPQEVYDETKKKWNEMRNSDS